MCCSLRSLGYVRSIELGSKLPILPTVFVDCDAGYIVEGQVFDDALLVLLKGNGMIVISMKLDKAGCMEVRCMKVLVRRGIRAEKERIV